MPTQVDVALTPSQIKFHALKCPFPGFFGGVGSGKSHMMGFQAVTDSTHSSKVVIGVYEPTYDLIKSIAIPRIEYWLSNFGFSYKVNWQDHCIYTSSSKIGDFDFKTMEEPDRLIGYEHYRSHLDELDTLQEEKALKVWQKVLARNRQQEVSVPQEYKKWSERQRRYVCVNRISAYTTPEGYKFCYKNWVLRDHQDYQYVQSKTEENPEVTDEFIQQLRDQYPQKLIEAYLEGKFVNLQSSTVYDRYDRDRHRSFERIQNGETLYIGLDFNVDDMAATIFVRRGNTWHAVEEITKEKDTITIIRVIKERYELKGHHVIIYPDASCRARTNNNSSETALTLLKQAGFELRYKQKNPLIKDRVLIMNTALERDIVFVNDVTAPTVAKCLEQQAYDKNNEPEKRRGNDHQNDATTYVISYECAVRKPLFHIDYSFAQRI